jgi:hypothetical protein
MRFSIIYNLYQISGYIIIIKSRRMKCSGHTKVWENEKYIKYSEFKV